MYNMDNCKILYIKETIKLTTLTIDKSIFKDNDVSASDY